MSTKEKPKKETFSIDSKKRVNPYLVGLVLGTIIFGFIAYSAFEFSRDRADPEDELKDISTVAGLLEHGETNEILLRLDEMSVGPAKEPLPSKVVRLEQRMEIAEFLLAQEISEQQKLRACLNYFRSTVSLLVLKHQNGISFSNEYSKLESFATPFLSGEDERLKMEASVSLLIGSIFFEANENEKGNESPEQSMIVQRLDQLLKIHSDDLGFASQLISIVQLFDKWNLPKEVELSALNRLFLHFRNIPKFHSMTSAINHRRIRIQYDLYVLKIVAGLESSDQAILSNAKMALADPHFSTTEVQFFIDVGYRFESVNHYDSADAFYEFACQFFRNDESQDPDLLDKARKGKSRIRLMKNRVACLELLQSSDVRPEILEHRLLILMFLDHDRQKEHQKTIDALASNRLGLGEIGLIAFSAESPLENYWSDLTVKLKHPNQLIDDFDGRFQEKFFVGKLPYILLIKDGIVIDLRVTNEVLRSLSL